MANIDQFLLDFENLIFDEHLDRIKTFKSNNGNAVLCRCYHINAEKEEISRIMEKYINLSKRFKLQGIVSSGIMNREDKIRTGSYDVVG